MRIHPIVSATLFLCSRVASAQTLYVDGSTGDDAVPKASNSASSPWRTIGRAAWGSTSRATPNPSEAAAAGDTVLIAGGTYTTAESVNDRWGVVYNPANSGTVTSPITFSCVGICVLGAPNANAPVIGSEERDYIKWYADVARAHAWEIRAYGLMTGSASDTEVNTTPDTGPVVCHGGTGCWVEGAVIDGGAPVDYGDNWNGVRVENCTACTIRNNTIRNFLDGTNCTAITLYGAPDAVVEHNYATNTSGGVYFKDTGATLPQQNVRARYNRFEDVGECFRWSTTAEERNYVYQNLCTNSAFALLVTGGGLSNDWIFNNTFHGMANAGVFPSGLGSGGRFWNNIVVDVDIMIYNEAAPLPPATVINLEHNAYHAYSQFYSGPDGGQDFAGYLATFPDHDQAAPPSIDADPLFIDAAAGNYRLCTGAGEPAASCRGASPAIALGVDIFDLNTNSDTADLIPAGAYLTGNEILGPGETQGGSGGAPDGNMAGGMAGADGGMSAGDDDGAAGGSGGCHCAVKRATRSPDLVLTALLAIAFLRRRRRSVPECR